MLVGGAAGELAWVSELLEIPSEDLPFLPFVFVLFGADMTFEKSENRVAKTCQPCQPVGAIFSGRC